MRAQAPIVKDLVLVGGGHSHVAVLKSLAMRPLDGVRTTLITREVHTPYSGMLPGYIAGHYALDDCHIDLRPLAGLARARLYHAAATGIDLDRRLVLAEGRPPIPYDVVSIDIGSAPRSDDVPGAAEHAVPVKPIGRFVARFEALAERVLARAGKARIAVVGTGAGGTELALAVRYRLASMLAARGLPPDAFTVTLIGADAEVLASHNARTRAKFARILAGHGIATVLGRRVVSVAAGSLALADGTAIEADEILWVTQAGAQTWPADAGLDVDEGGFIRVDASLRSTSHPEVFAAGDVAAVLGHPRPKAGVFAVRQGPPLAANLRCALTGRPLKAFAPQRRYLSLISTGEKYAVASRGNWAVEGAWAWRLKDWIDRRWMRKYRDLPEMKEEEGARVAPGIAGAVALAEISAMAMRCGGCGAKIGRTVLDRAMEGIVPLRRDDVLVGLAEPDDAAVVAVPQGKVVVQTVDHFRSFVDDPYVFGRIAANHALGDVYAMGAEPQTALAIVTVAVGLESKVEAEIRDMMAGVTEVLTEAGAALVGGHTGEGAERALGLCVNGLAERAAVLRKAGMRPGEALILTKPLGTGTLLAADMQGKAKGRWIDGALAAMQQSSRVAAEVLRRHGASACTDVTGFGLLGHLVEMVRASGVDVEVSLAAVPVLDGAAECIAGGLFSSLQPQNLRLRRAVRDLDSVAGEPLYPILYDPQTAGGLLASVPAERAAACLAALKAAGYAEAAIIGRVRAASGDLAPIVVRPGPLGDQGEGALAAE